MLYIIGTEFDKDFGDLSRDNGALVVECFFINLLTLTLLEHINGLQAPATDTLVNKMID